MIIIKKHVAFILLHPLTLFMGISLGLHLWGIKRDLPFTPRVDEPLFVLPAIHIAASGNLYPANPDWFLHPGSTIIYPLAILYHLWHAIIYGGNWVIPDYNLHHTFDSNLSEFYLLGRFLSIAYSVMSVALVYLIGQRAYGRQAALIGSWLSIFSPFVIGYAKQVRTDSASVFFVMIGLLLCLRLYDCSTIGNRVMAGIAAGLAIATKYYLIALIPILLAVDGFLLRQRASQPYKFKAINLSIGLLVASLTFILLAPFFLIDFQMALLKLKHEALRSHLGADGLSFSRNLLWYLIEVIPKSIDWPQMILAAIGIVLVIYRHHHKQLLLLGFSLIYLAEISASNLHWERWIVPLLPLLALFAADALSVIITYLSKYLESILSATPHTTPSGAFLGAGVKRGLIMSTVLFISVQPLYQVVLMDIRHANPSTRILAREWILHNIPIGSRIAQEWYTAPLTAADFYGYGNNRTAEPPAKTNFILFQQYSLSQNHTLNDYFRSGYRYLVVSSDMYERYMAEHDRYPSEVSFYRQLFSEGILLQKFEPSATRDGPVIQIYKLLLPPGSRRL